MPATVQAAFGPSGYLRCLAQLTPNAVAEQPFYDGTHAALTTPIAFIGAWVSCPSYRSDGFGLHPRYRNPQCFSTPSVRIPYATKV